MTLPHHQTINTSHILSQSSNPHERTLSIHHTAKEVLTTLRCIVYDTLSVGSLTETLTVDCESKRNMGMRTDERVVRRVVPMALDFFHKRIEGTNHSQQIIECHDERVSYPNSFAFSK